MAFATRSLSYHSSLFINDRELFLLVIFHLLLWHFSVVFKKQFGVTPTEFKG